ncbi:hypothetical protein IEO70_13215 [Bacillus sp. AGMB 02131]|uniref:Uncharacterized protein n=1 Tax=Peribacillus faecalis TaxID=2772559 RepID=A0A927D0N6_9BACI|nr:hypothetical protein [Peribacillus faecalis]MBD3109305.1 hypothetical protein [Peribacillus faecalis]
MRLIEKVLYIFYSLLLFGFLIKVLGWVWMFADVPMTPETDLLGLFLTAVIFFLSFLLTIFAFKVIRETD